MDGTRTWAQVGVVLLHTPDCRRLRVFALDVAIRWDPKKYRKAIDVLRFWVCMGVVVVLGL